MKICPSCYDTNEPTNTTCRRCHASLSPSQRTCPSGRHVMDPSWIECVYCKSETVAHTPSPAGDHRRTVVESAGRAVAGPGPGLPRKTEVENSRPGGKSDNSGSGAPGGKTVLYSAGEAANHFPNATPPLPRIVGVLFTHSWRPGGQIFPVREGRNLIGRDAERCDIVIAEDPTLSAVNTHITYRRQFVVGDNTSMGGTDVNGVPVEEQFQPLPNYARIRTGSTHWIFVMLDPGAMPATVRATAPITRDGV